jgi:formylglycine-generating enzyme required for sulfatase activity
MQQKRPLFALAVLALVCRCATPQVTVVRTVPPQFSIVPAKVVAVVHGAQPRDSPDGNEDAFLDLFIHKLRRIGPYEVLDERNLATDWNAYLKKTRADVVLRVSLGGYCHNSIDLESMQITDGEVYEELDGTCEADIDLIRPGDGGGALLGHAHVVGGGHDVDGSVALNGAWNDAAQEMIDAFMPERENETMALDEKAPAFAEGMQKIKKGDLAGARSLWESALKTTPDSAPLLYNLGAVCEALRDSNAAGPYYLQATKLAPDDARYHDALEKLNDRLDDAETAAKTADVLATEAAAKKAAEASEIAARDAETLQQVQNRAAKMTGEAVADTKSGVYWIRIPSGTFTMGCTDGDTICDDDDEKPPHPVTISRPFDLAMTVTTNDQYQLCIDAGACRGKADTSKNGVPVVNVTWDQAQQFCAWIGGALPREAEWEWAARGGVEGWRYPWGRTAQTTDGNFGVLHNFEYLGFQPAIAWSDDPNAAHLTPVGTYAKNGYGLDGMAGNVWEWTADWAGPYTDQPQTDPVGGETGTRRVLRGGAYTNTAGAARVSSRIARDPNAAAAIIGFRCARDVP